MRLSLLPGISAACLSLGLGLPARVSAGEPARIEFNRDVRPILSENCYFCHGPDKNQRKAKLRLDERESALKHGAIVPGKPDDSELVLRILSEDEDVMPPREAHKTLSEAQKQTLQDWIAQGAEYQAHWAYVAPLRRPVPDVRRQDWVRNPIDAFLLASLESRGIDPAPEAQKRRLVRRAYLDLLGLPPTAEEARALVAGGGPKAN